jgi:hypothetical protein
VPLPATGSPASQPSFVPLVLSHLIRQYRAIPPYTPSSYPSALIRRQPDHVRICYLARGSAFDPPHTPLQEVFPFFAFSTTRASSFLVHVRRTSFCRRSVEHFEARVLPFLSLSNVPAFGRLGSHRNAPARLERTHQDLAEMADEPDRQRSQYPPPDDPNRGYYPPAPREGNARDDKNSYPAPEDANRTGHYQQGSPATGPPRDDRMPYPPPDPSRQPPYSYDPRAGQYQPPPHQWNGQYPPPQYPVSFARLGAAC